MLETGGISRGATLPKPIVLKRVTRPAAVPCHCPLGQTHPPLDVLRSSTAACPRKGKASSRKRGSTLRPVHQGRNPLPNRYLLSYPDPAQVVSTHLPCARRRTLSTFSRPHPASTLWKAGNIISPRKTSKHTPRPDDSIDALVFSQPPADNRFDGYGPLPGTAIVCGSPARYCHPASPGALDARHAQAVQLQSAIAIPEQREWPHYPGSARRCSGRCHRRPGAVPRPPTPQRRGGARGIACR